MNKYIHVNIFKIYTVCVFIYTHNKYTQYTHIYNINTNFWLQLIVAQHQWKYKNSYKLTNTSISMLLITLPSSCQCYIIQHLYEKYCAQWLFFSQYREERFRMTSESTNQRVLWWSITQTIILIITGIWQMRHLKSFFEAKKLVWRSDRITETITQVTFIVVMVFKHGNTLCFISIFLFKFNSVQLYLEQINWDTMSLNGQNINNP